MLIMTNDGKKFLLLQVKKNDAVKTLKMVAVVYNQNLKKKD